MTKLNEKAQLAFHLTNQLKSACNELFKAMTDETRIARKSDEDLGQNVANLTDFDFVKTMMLMTQDTDAIALQLQQVFLSLSIVAFSQPGFLEKVKKDIASTGGLRDCDCPICKAAVNDVLAQAEEIVKKSVQK